MTGPAWFRRWGQTHRTPWPVTGRLPTGSTTNSSVEARLVSPICGHSDPLTDARCTLPAGPHGWHIDRSQPTVTISWPNDRHHVRITAKEPHT